MSTVVSRLGCLVPALGLYPTSTLRCTTIGARHLIYLLDLHSASQCQATLSKFRTACRGQDQACKLRHGRQRRYHPANNTYMRQLDPVQPKFTGREEWTTDILTRPRHSPQGTPELQKKIGLTLYQISNHSLGPIVWPNTLNAVEPRPYSLESRDGL